MIYQFRWNSATESGYVVNDIYPMGYVFSGADLKPILTATEYYSLVYDESTNTFELSVGDDTKTMTAEQKLEVLNLCSAWTDVRYLDDSVTFASLQLSKMKSLRAFFNQSYLQLSNNAGSHEVSFWQNQELEARAWIIDNAAPTPIIDVLLSSRGADEMKDELVAKILAKADLYNMNYAELLGRFKKAIRLAETAQTIEELEAIGF